MRNIYLTAICSLLMTSLWCQGTARLLYDINTNSSNIGDYPSEFTELNGKLYFSYMLNGSSELWVYDSLSGSSLVADINPGAASSPQSLTTFNNKLYFSANDGVNGRELWEYDGINPPTMVADINPGPFEGVDASYPFLVYSGKLYFRADDGVNGRELWVYDGTNPPTMVADINTTGNSNAKVLAIMGTKLYFSADDGVSGTELWEYDGINPPTMVADINIGSGDALYLYASESAISFNNKLYFGANDGVNGEGLWEYDGINPPTTVGAISAGSGVVSTLSFEILANKLYFNADNSGVGNNLELWVYDGTNPPTMVADVDPTLPGALPELKVFNNKLYFQGYDVVNGVEFWVYDGINPPIVFADIHPNGSSYPSDLVIYSNKLYFSAEEPTLGREMWIYDGISAPIQNEIITTGANAVANSEKIEFNNKLYFSANDELSGNNYELWEYDGVNTPVIVADINSSGASNPQSLTVFNNKLYFSANDGLNGVELWEYDGINPPLLLTTISIFSNPQSLTVFNNKLYFGAYRPLDGFELWEYDGINPPSLVADINTGSNDSYPDKFTVFNNKLYFSANDGVNGTELWEYDGINPPSLVADIRAGNMGCFLSNLIVFNNKLYFSAYDGLNGMELWEYDGINLPVMVADIAAGNQWWPNFIDPIIYNNKLYFGANDSTSGFELWEYDGINLPSMLVDINIGAADALDYIQNKRLGVYNGKLYFSANDGVNGTELWEYDGTNSPTLLADINLNPYLNDRSSNPNQMIEFKGGLIFNATDVTHGNELWEYRENITSTQNFTECQGYSISVALNTYNTTGIYNDTLVSSSGIDSIVTTNLTILPSANDSLSFNLCAGESVLVATNTYNTTGVYSDTLIANNGCDSIITTNLVINPNPVVVINNITPDTLCQGDAAISLTTGTPASGVYTGPGVNATSFDPATAGLGTHTISYEFTDANACSNSDSTTVTVELCASIENAEFASLKVYPNPTENFIYIDFLEVELDGAQLHLYDALGRLILQKQPTEQLESLSLEHFAKGVYLLQIQTEKVQITERIIKY